MCPDPPIHTAFVCLSHCLPTHSCQAARETRIAEEQAELGDSLGAIEERRLREVLRPMQLAIRDIAVRCRSFVRSF
jgi:hypothetical protein